MARYTGIFRLFPMAGTSEDGFIDTDKKLIRKSVLNIINTYKGSRIYDPDYGTNLHRLIHEQNIQRTRNIAKNEIIDAVTKYEPRAKILQVEAYPGEGEQNSEVIVIVSLLYVEYGEEEDLEIRLSTEQQWISQEGTHIDPIEEWFKNGKS
jgi:phage baseplate assembly protein W